jgi:hypothetical protein
VSSAILTLSTSTVRSTGTVPRTASFGDETETSLSASTQNVLLEDSQTDVR